MNMRLSGLLAAAAIGLLLVPPAAAQGPKGGPDRKNNARVVFVPAKSAPPVPGGMKVTCLKGPNVLQSSSTCPVVKYLGITTWAYSFINNQNAMALVSYDAQNKVVRNVTRQGLRYVWNMISSPRSKTVEIFGQSNQRAEVPWGELGPVR
jgi:hypothetical protein